MIDEQTHEKNALSQNIRSVSIWRRFFFMLVLVFIWWVSRIVIGALVIIQAFWALFTGEPNTALARLGSQLAIFVQQIIRYLTFNTDERPYPFDLDWPSE